MSADSLDSVEATGRERRAIGASAPPVPRQGARTGSEPKEPVLPHRRPGGAISALDAEDAHSLPVGARGAVLWRPRDLRDSSELSHVPCLFWLMETLRPREVAVLGLGQGVAVHALCQAAEQLDLGAGITVHAEPGAVAALGAAYERAASRASAFRRLRYGTLADAPARHEGAVDLLVAVDPALMGDPDRLLDAWRGRLSDGAAVALLGARERDGGGAAIRLGGTTIRQVGGGQTAPLGRLRSDAAGEGGLGALMARVGAVWRSSAEAEARAGLRADEEALALARRAADEALAALTQRTAALAALQQAHDELRSDHRLVCARRDELHDALLRAKGAASRPPAPEAADGREAAGSDEGALTETDAPSAPRPARKAPEKPSWSTVQSALRMAELKGRRARGLRSLDWRTALGQPPAWQQIALILRSPLFDADWYADRYPDVAAHAKRPPKSLYRHRWLAAHYLRSGAAEGRDPGPRFSTRSHYLRHPSAAAKGWNALVHHHLVATQRPPRPKTAREAARLLRSRLADTRLLRASPLFDVEWYATQTLDIPRGMSPAWHYIQIGAAEGLDPGPDFSTRAYLADNSDVAASGMNPLVHYLRFGEGEGRHILPAGTEDGGRRVEVLRKQLLGLGFTDPALAELAEIARDDPNPGSRARAALELGRWHLRRENGSDHERAIDWLDRAAEAAAEAREAPMRQRVAVIRVASLAALGRREEAERIVEAERAKGTVPSALLLASSAMAPDEAGRLAVLNEVMRRHGLPDIGLRDAPEGGALYDRLASAGDLEPVEDGPLVSVLIAAYNAEATLPLTLRALAEQTWRRHEVIVVDDASTDGTRSVVETFAHRDPRVRLLALERNGGAYAARNRGLALARGEFVTLQDADDWTHATRLEIQARHLMANPQRVACTTQQARVREDLTFARWSVQGELIFTNTASLQFRREPVLERLGGWDEVRFGADAEMIRRLRAAFGRSAVADLTTGPVTLQRYSEASATADPATGFDGGFMGARLEYLEAQQAYHARGGALRYAPGSRPFPVPRIMRPDHRRGEARHLDVVIASEFRMKGGSTHSSIQEIRAQRQAGLGTGLVKMYRYDLRLQAGAIMFSGVRDEVDGETVSVLAYGEEVTCDLLILRYPPILQHVQRYVPRILPKRIKVIVNQPPMSDYGEDGVRRYALPEAEANLRRMFGRPGEWHPIGPLVRQALHEHHADELAEVDLRPDDWVNVIDLDEWDRGLGGGPRAKPGAPLRIGRHARDNAVKWPGSAEEILEVYPKAEDVEIHVLGGADAPARLLGGLPGNWRVRPFNAISPRSFLAQIDVFVYYTHPLWVESFGRAIVEAMAAGVPCVLPPTYEGVFGPAAVYAPPSEAIAAARRLHADADAYRAQALAAQALVRERFGYGLHLDRLREAGVRQG